MPTTTSQRDWRELVLKADGPQFYPESLYPTVYAMSGGRTFRDSGPEKGVYEKDEG